MLWTLALVCLAWAGMLASSTLSAARIPVATTAGVLLRQQQLKPADNQHNLDQQWKYAGWHPVQESFAYIRPANNGNTNTKPDLHCARVYERRTAIDDQLDAMHRERGQSFGSDVRAGDQTVTQKERCDQWADRADDR